MALGDAIQKYAHKEVTTCTTGLLLAQLSPADSKALQTALDNGVPTIAIVKACRDEGYKISENSMNAHRQGKCKCVTK